MGNGIVERSRGGKCMGVSFCGNDGIGQRECSRRGANLVVRREAAAPRRLRKRGNGANSSSASPCKTTRALYPDGALPRRCRASLATALQGVPSAFAGWLVSAPCVGLCGFAAWRLGARKKCLARSPRRSRRGQSRVRTLFIRWAAMS